MTTVQWSDNAMIRLREQAKYIAEQSGSSEVAWKWASEVFNEVDGLADFPQIGHPLPEFPDTPYLEILVRKYFRVIYRLTDETCFIVTIRRTSMLLDETILDELNSVFD